MSMMLHKTAAMAFVCALAVACTSGASAPDSSESDSPPITESESGRIVGQPVEVDSFTVEVTSEGSALFVVTGSVPSPCHEAFFGFEEPNADGVMTGESESWLDSECDAAVEPTEFSETMEIDGLPPGDYVANLDTEFEASFVIPTHTTSAPSTTGIRSTSDDPSSQFEPLGGPNCNPSSPFEQWGGGLAEVKATSSNIEVWGLLWQIPPLTVDKETKMVWRVTGTGDFDIRAFQGNTQAELTWGPVLHESSDFERPGDEWGTAFTFPAPGCWEIEVSRGTDTAHVWVQVAS